MKIFIELFFIKTSTEGSDRMYEMGQIFCYSIAS